MNKKIYIQAQKVIEELCKKAKVKANDIIVIGCSTSEVCGRKIGTESNIEVAESIFEAFYEYALTKKVTLAVQCCEHLNRAIVTEREIATSLETVNVIPQPKAGGSLAAYAYKKFKNPVVVEEIRADAGLDIGFTLIGMHLKKVAVPLRLENDFIGEAKVIAARIRPKFIGGERAVYDTNLL